MRDIFIIGSRGLPARYGGFETFVEELISHQVSQDIRYHVACLSDNQHQTHFAYKGADCFTINPPKLGPARVIAYDLMALTYALKIAEQNQLRSPIFYILGNTAGGFIRPWLRKIRELGGKLFVNPDGLEWKRSKWSRPVQAYLKYAEQQMCRQADLVIADNLGIQTYINQAYPQATTTYIAYGTEIVASPLSNTALKVQEFFKQHALEDKHYYLILGRFVPENNYETAIREFMASQTKCDLVIITNHEGTAYFDQLKRATGCDKDSRIKFVGTVYDKELLAYIRQSAFAYIHGHEVGGTNPGLLEALGHTDLNLIFDVDFNRRVAEDSGLYWTKEKGHLTKLIDKVDGQLSYQELGMTAKRRIAQHYTWTKIVGEYEELFLDEG